MVFLTCDRSVTRCDLGCGPGRLAAALATAGWPVLGVDISPQAVRFARRRGVPALLADALGALPDEGRWQSALLADGNIGIGGDPVRLLRRTRRLLRPGGRLLVEVDPPGHGSWQGDVALSDGRRVSDAFAWAFVGADQIADIAAEVGSKLGDPWEVRDLDGYGVQVEWSEKDQRFELTAVDPSDRVVACA